jgi:hypothetical protein
VAADARAERIGAKPSRAVVARGLRHTVLTHEDSAVFGTQQKTEAKKNYLVTMTGTASCSEWPVTELLSQFSQRCSGALERDFLPARRSISFCDSTSAATVMSEKGGLEQRLAASISL